MTQVARIAILLVWLVPIAVGMLACLLYIGVVTGFDIMADWIERIEP